MCFIAPISGFIWAIWARKNVIYNYSHIWFKSILLKKKFANRFKKSPDIYPKRKKKIFSKICQIKPCMHACQRGWVNTFDLNFWLKVNAGFRAGNNEKTFYIFSKRRIILEHTQDKTGSTWPAFLWQNFCQNRFGNLNHLRIHIRGCKWLIFYSNTSSDMNF